jgi:hypothetical protein
MTHLTGLAVAAGIGVLLGAEKDAGLPVADSAGNHLGVLTRRLPLVKCFRPSPILTRRTGDAGPTTRDTAD